jgi:hypothetical protein
LPRRVTSCLSADGSISFIPTHIFTALSTLPLSTDDGLSTALLKPTGTSSPPTRRSSPIRCPDSISHHTPFMSTSAFTSLSTTRHWQMHFAPPRPLTLLLFSRDKRSTESASPISIFSAAKRDPITYSGPGNDAFGWKLFEMHLKLYIFGRARYLVLKTENCSWSDTSASHVTHM